MELIENKVYRLNVVRVEEAKGNFYFVVIINGKESWVKLYDYQKATAEKKKKIDCLFKGVDKYGSYKFVQDRLFILNDLYEENVEYEFDFVSESTDVNTCVGFSVLRDEYNINHRLYDKLSEKQKEGKEKIICIVESIDSIKKVLKLKLKKQQIERVDFEFQGTWFDADRVFSDINRIDIKDRFFEPLLASNDNDAYLKSMREHYSSHNNLWIFSLLNYIDKTKVRELSRDGEYDELEKFTELVIDLQKWVLEESDFLSFFSEEHRREAILKSETELTKYQAQLVAVKLIRKGEQEDFIKSILSSLRKSKRIVWRKNDRIQTLLRILSLDENILQHDIDTFIELIMLLSEGEDLLDDYNRTILNDVLSWRIGTEIAQLNQIMRYGADENNILAKKQTIINIIRIVGAQVILSDNKEDIARVKKSQFYRYICLIGENAERRMLLDVAMDSLIRTTEDRHIFNWQEILNFDVDKIVKLSQKVVSKQSDEKKIGLYTSSRKGYMYMSSGQLIIVPKGLAGPSNSFNEGIKTIHTIFNEKIGIGSFYNMKDLLCEGNISDVYKSWASIITGRAINCEHEIKAGVCVRVLVKKQNQEDNLKNLLFVSIIDADIQKEACIHVTQMSSKFISDARVIFDEGDILEAKVLRIRPDGNIELTLRPYTEVFRGSLTSVEEDLRSLVIGHANSSRDDSWLISKELLTELVSVLDLYIKIENDIQSKLFYIMYNRLLAGMLKINLKTAFYTFVLYYNIALYEFIQSNSGETETKYQDWFAFICSKYPDLESKRLIFKLIESINNPVLLDNDLLNGLVENEDIHISKVAKLVQALRYLNEMDGSQDAFLSVKKVLNNILSEQNELINIDLDEISEESLEDSNKYDSLEAEDDDIESYGYENQTTEFKTSYVYHAGSNGINIQEQANVILKVICGFLNADGGKLFIGVNDDGQPVGILDDLHYLNDNKDSYERRIRRDIVSSFSKDINGLISIEFDKNNVCIITVPSYHKPVSYNNSFWQRQGNETRIINGDDLIPFIMRRSKEVDGFSLKKKLEEKGDLVKKAEEYYINSPQVVSRLNRDSRIIAYWNLFTDGSYIVMDNPIVSEKILQAIPIADNMRNGYLLQCYSNGCVNKYPIKNILEKKKGYKYINGFYHLSTLKMLSIITGDLYLVIKSEFNNEVFVKIYNTANISLHGSLHLKGNQVVDNLGDNISYYVLGSGEENKLNKLVYNSSTGKGKNIENEYYQKERNILKVMGVI